MGENDPLKVVNHPREGELDLREGENVPDPREWENDQREGDPLVGENAPLEGEEYRWEQLEDHIHFFYLLLLKVLFE